MRVNAPMPYKTADTSWFARCGFGIAVHWTAKSVPVAGSPLPFAAAVDAFDVQRFVGQVADCGADYLLFTLAHALQMLPAPCDRIEKLLPGRTTRRDLVGELANACTRRGLRFIAYYNHSCNGGEDPAWEQAVGYHSADKHILAENLCGIVAELGSRYGSAVPAWWFDSPYSLDASGPNRSVTTDMGAFRFPWEEFTAAAKSGYADRLVTYNPGWEPEVWDFLYTTHQDYLAGEANNLVEAPVSRFAGNGLQNHRWVCLDNPDWVHARPDTPLCPSRYAWEQLLPYLQAARAASTPVTFNVDTDQGGQLLPSTLQLLSRLSIR